MATPASAEPPALIPRQTLFSNPDRASVQLGPDGQRISYLAPLHGVLNVWVGPADSPQSARPVTRDQGRGIRFYGWTYTNSHIAYIQDMDGDENWHLYVVDLASGNIGDLTPIEGVQARIQETSPRFPEELLIGLNGRNPQFHDIYRINLLTGKRDLVQQNDGFAGFLTDENFNIQVRASTDQRRRQ